jgi:hypothetical protein
MAAEDIIHARHAALYVSKAAITFDASTSLDQESGLGSIFKVKNLTITPPKSDVEMIHLWGSDILDTLGAAVPVTGTFQHAAFDEKAWTEGRITGTVLFSSDELGSSTPNTAAVQDAIESLFHGVAIDIADTPAFARNRYGDLSTSGRISVGNMIFVFNNGSQIQNVGMINVTVTAMGDIKPTGADGHWEMDFEAACLPQNFTRELED